MCSCNKKKSTTTGEGAGGSGGAPLRMAMRTAAPVRVAEVACVKPVVEPPENVDTSVWGPSLWKILHIAAEFTGTSSHSRLWYALISAMCLGIPCDECRGHFVARNAAAPLRISRIPGGVHNSIVKWALNLHNFVNVATESGHGQWTVEQCRAVYGGNRVSRLAEARVALDAIRGVAGGELVEALDRLLAFLGR